MHSSVLTYEFIINGHSECRSQTQDWRTEGSIRPHLLKSVAAKTSKITVKSKWVLRHVLLKQTCDRKKQPGLPSLKKGRWVGEITVFEHAESCLKSGGNHFFFISEWWWHKRVVLWFKIRCWKKMFCQYKWLLLLKILKFLSLVTLHSVKNQDDFILLILTLSKKWE